MLRAGQSIAQFEAQLLRNNRALQGAAAHTGRVVDQITRVDGASKGFLATMRDLSIVTGVMTMGISAIGGAMNGWFGEIVRVNAEMQRMQIMMQGMSKSSDPIKEAGDNVKYLRDMAMNTPFSLETLAGSFVKLQSTGIDPMAGSMQSLADGIAAFGGSDAQFERATVAITQMSGKGVIQMEELRQQLGEHMPRAVELMARSMGVGIAQLLEEISTGTMAAQPALNAFYGELERTYGGRARSMMQTFAGQMKQTTTLWTNLVTAIGGMDQATYEYAEGGFFRVITEQLGDLNKILAQPFAFDLAEKVGAGLTNVVRFIRGAIETAVQFRREIQFVASAVALGFAFKAGIAGIASLSTGMVGLVQHMKIFKIEMASAASFVATGATGLRTMTAAGTGTQMMLMGVGMGIKGVGTALSIALPWVGVLSVALYAASTAFDMFGSKARQAYDDLKEFGAETRSAAMDVLNARREQIQKDLDHAIWVQGAGGAAAQQAKRREDDLRKQLAELEESAARLVEEAGRREDETAASKFQREVDLTLEARQRLYDEEARQIQDHHDAEVQKTGINVEEVEKSRREALYAERMKQLDDNETYFRDLLKQNEDADATQDEATQQRLARERGIINANLLQVTNAQRELAKAGAHGTGIEHFANPEGNADAIAKGTKSLETMRREIMEMQLQMRGATKAHAEMQVAIASGDYGSVAQGGEEVAKLHEQLIATTKAKEALDELMKSRTEAENDVEKARKAALEEQFEILVKLREQATGVKMLPSEINQLKLDTGFYDGLGPTDMITAAVEKVIEQFGNVETNAQTAGTAIQDEAFGEQSQSAITTANLELIRFNQNLQNTSALANGISFGAFDGIIGGAGVNGNYGPSQSPGVLPTEVNARMLAAMERLMSKGWSREVAAGIVGNIGGESGYNPNAINPGDGADGSDSIGLVQWNAERARNLKAFAAQQGKQWNDYMTQIDFVDWELRNTHKSVGDRLKGPVSLQGATDTVLRQYEVPADPGSKFGKRLGYAEQAYGMSGQGAQLPAIEAANAAIETQNGLIETGVSLTLELTQANNDNVSVEQRNRNNQWLLERNELMDELNGKLEKAGRGITDGDTDALQTLRDAIEAGEMGDSKNADDRQYERLIQLATQLDNLNAKIATDKKAATDIDEETKRLEEERLELNRQLAEAQKAANDPNYQPESSTLRNLETRLDKYVEDARKRYGAESEIYRQALATRNSMLTNQRQLEVTGEQAKLSQEMTTRQQGLMTEGQQRQAAMQQKLAQVDAWVQRARDAGMEEVEITRQAEAMKAAIRDEYAANASPMTAQMREWGDLQGNLAKQSTQWMDSLAGGFTDLLMGTGDLKSVINGIVKDMVNMLVKFTMSGMKGAGGDKASKGGQMAKGAKGAGGGGAKKAMFGVAHTGGIIGSSQLSTRRGSAAMFSGAPKFHTGGIIGPRLMPSEVPIIAQEGEGVFTKEQMNNLQPAGMGATTFAVNAPITVNGSSGTPEQNADLAKQMRREMESGFRAIAADEIRKQQRPGNMLNSRGSR